MAAPEPLRHHFLPEFYTRWWVGADGRLVRWTRPTLTHIDMRRSFPSQIGWERNLYSSPDQNSANVQRLETQFFQHVDNRASLVLRKLNEDVVAPLTDEEVTAWTVFIMSMFHRTPENLAAIKQGGEQVWQNTIPELRDRYAHLRSATDPATFDEYLARRPDYETDRNTLDILPGLILNPTILNFINNLTWIRIEIPAPYPDLLISDDPVGRTNGLQTTYGHLAMPLSPRRLFVAAPLEETLQIFNAMPLDELSSAMNKWTVESARHFVCATDETRDAYIRENFGRSPKEGIGRSIR